MEKTDAIKLLAIDDKPDNLITLSAVVRDALPQTRVLTSTNGPAGIELAAAEDPDVILLDIVMPGMDGFEVCRRLKADDRIRDIPVVFLTTLKTDAASRIKALEVGGEGFLAKPLETAELTAQIRAMTKVKAANRSQRKEKDQLEALVAERTRTMRETESRYRTMFENMAAASCVDEIVYKDGRAVDYRILNVNPAFERITGIRRQEAAGALASALYGLGQAPFLDVYGRVAETGEPAEFEAWFEPSQKYLHFTVGCPKPGFFSTVFTDITARRKAEEARKQSDERFRIAQEMSPDGFTILRPVRDTQNRVIDFIWVYENDSIAKLNGTDPEKVVGQRLLELFPGHRDTQFMKAYQQVAESGESITFEDGYSGESMQKQVWFRIVVVPMVEDIAILAQDITERKRAEEELHQTQAILQAAMDCSPAGIAIADAPDGQLRYVNDAGLGIRGGDRQSLVNGVGVEQYVASWTLLDLDGSSLGTDDVPLARAIMFGETNSRDFIIRREEGEDRIVEASAAPIKDETGKIAAGIVVFTDITARRQAEEELEKAEQNLRSTVDGLSAHIVVVDEYGKIILTNKSYRDFGELNGFEPSTVSEGTNYLAVCDAASGENSEEAKPFAEGIREVLSGKRQSFELEYPCHAPDEKRWFIGRVTLFGGEGHRRVIVAHENITERKQMEKVLQESEERYRGLLANLEAGVVVHAPDTSIIMHNPRASEMLGLSDEQMRGKLAIDPEWNFINENGKPYLIEEYPVNQIASKRQAIRDLVLGINRPATNDVIWVSVNGIPVLDRKAEISEIVISFIDITERKLAEEERARLQAQLMQAQKMETVGRLAGGIAHDFNNLLAVIMLRTELALQMADPSTPLHRSLTTIYTTAQRSADLVRQLLGFARKQTIAPRVLDLNATVVATLPMLHTMIGEEIELAWYPGLQLWPVKLDPSQLDQILTSLCVNARDAIGGVGRIMIETENVELDQAAVTTGLTVPPGDYVMLAVTDNGNGIDPEILAHIFEPFFTTKAVGKGTGLGLATVDGIVQQNGGQITVYSKPGFGACFRVYLPRHGGEAMAPAANQPQELSHGHGETVLLVEDEAAVLEMGLEALELLGYKVIATTGPGAALHLAAHHAGKIDLLITDVVMPEMNGHALAEQVAVIQPGVKRLYVSGYPADFVARRGVLEEGVHFLQKPFALRVLAAKVREVLVD